MKKVIIIGGGIAGLSAGILARKNGFETEIFESHFLPGGLCTSWKRGGYTFDGCIRYVYGSGEGKFCNSLMRKVGAVEGTEYVHHEESGRVETSAGETVIFHCDLDQLEDHLLQISPGDGKRIKAMIRAAKSVSRTAMPAVGPASLMEFGHMAKALMHFIPVLAKYGKTSLEGFASGFQSAALREAFTKYYGYADLGGLPVFFMIIDMAQHHVMNAGWPVGGSLAFAEKIEKRYLALGGKMNYRVIVDKIIVKDGKAVGIRLADGKEFSADCILSAGDVHNVLETMLDGKFTPPELQTAFLNEKIITPLVQVSLGVAMDLSDIPHAVTISLKEPVTVAGRSYDHLSFKHYCYDKSMAPEGKSAVTVVLETDFDAWAGLSVDRDRYRAEKQIAAAQVIDRLEKRIPGLREKVETVDVATPVTYQRYTLNYKGSPQGWQTSIGHMGNFPGRLPGLKNFYMIGQWVQRGGGLPGGAISAYNAVKQLCKDNGHRFR